MHLMKFSMRPYMLVLIAIFCANLCAASNEKKSTQTVNVDNKVQIKPISGSFINLFYQDERNKYSNPQMIDNMDPSLWKQKIIDLNEMGIDCVVFMAVANDGKSAYPSKVMPLAYDPAKGSPVSAIMDVADSLGMKVFMSIGWAQNQDDNLRVKKILDRQLDIMQELAVIYANHSSFYGWYLPVEDCLGPILSQEAVEAVNKLVMRAHKITPDKRTMISPYGIYCSQFDNAKFAEQIKKLKVDIIAYQDEIGCVREEAPLINLKDNWKKLRKIHDECSIEMWANCELFTWEKEDNDRESALIPAAFPRVLSQMAAASQGGAEKIISFMVNGLWDKNDNNYWLGQPLVSKNVANEYMQWKDGDERLSLLSASFTNNLHGMKVASTTSPMLSDGKVGEESVNDHNWAKFGKGHNEIVLDLKSGDTVDKIFIRFLCSAKNGIMTPDIVSVYTSENGESYKLQSIKNQKMFPNNHLDTWIEGLQFDIKDTDAKKIKITLDSSYDIMIDEIIPVSKTASLLCKSVSKVKSELTEPSQR